MLQSFSHSCIIFSTRRTWRTYLMATQRSRRRSCGRVSIKCVPPPSWPLTWPKMTDWKGWVLKVDGESVCDEGRVLLLLTSSARALFWQGRSYIIVRVLGKDESAYRNIMKIYGWRGSTHWYCWCHDNPSPLHHHRNSRWPFKFHTVNSHVAKK